MLTATAIEGLRAREARYEVSEEGGLRVRVYPSGAKSFIWRYRDLSGRQRVLVLGDVHIKGKPGGLSLKAARRELTLAQAERDRGIDPADQKAAEKQASIEKYKEDASAPTVEEILREYLRFHIERHGSEKTRFEFGRLVDTNIVPTCGKLKAAELTRARLVAALDRISENATPSVADHAAVVIRGAFNFAVKRGRLEFTPAQALPRYTSKAPRDRVLKGSEIKSLWEALETGAGVSAAVRLGIRLLLLTAQRRGSLALARWDEFEGDLWTMPSEHTKTGAAHVVPISPMAFGIVKQLRAITGETEWVLPNPTVTGPIRPAAMTRALIRLRDGGSYNLHDLRRTAATLMAQAGVQRFIIGRVLGHVDPSVTGIYDRYEYQAEKRRALEALARNVGTIIGKKQRAKVVSIK